MFQETREGLRLRVYVQPGSSKNLVVGPHNGALKVKIKAPPVEGKANDELVSFLASVFGLSKRAVTLERGDTGRQKTLLLIGLTQAAAEEILSRI